MEPNRVPVGGTVVRKSIHVLTWVGVNNNCPLPPHKLRQLTGFENGLLMKMAVAKDGLEGKSTGCGDVTGKQSTCGSLCG